jgi:hypothetical protein
MTPNPSRDTAAALQDILLDNKRKDLEMHVRVRVDSEDDGTGALR